MRAASVMTGFLIGTNYVNGGWISGSESVDFNEQNRRIKEGNGGQREIPYNPIDDMVWPLTETDLDILRSNTSNTET